MVSFRRNGNQVFRWSLTKISIYSVDLLIAWRGAHSSEVVAQHVIRICPIKLLSGIKNSRVGNETAVLFLKILAIFYEHFPVFLYKTYLTQNDISKL